MLGYADRHDQCARLSSIWRFTAKAEKWANDPEGAASRRRWKVNRKRPYGYATAATGWTKRASTSAGSSWTNIWRMTASTGRGRGRGGRRVPDVHQMAVDGQVDIADRRNERAGTRHQTNGSSSNGARKAKAKATRTNCSNCAMGSTWDPETDRLPRQHEGHTRPERTIARKRYDVQDHRHRQVRRTMREPLR